MSGIEENAQGKWQHLMRHLGRVDREVSGKPLTESAKDVEEVGKFWRSLRLEKGISRGEVLRIMGEAATVGSEYALFEQGLRSALDLPDNFLPVLAQTLGNPAYFDQYFEQFGHKLFPTLPKE